MSLLGMSVTTESGSGRQYVTGPGRHVLDDSLKVLDDSREGLLT